MGMRVIRGWVEDDEEAVEGRRAGEMRDPDAEARVNVDGPAWRDSDVLEEAAEGAVDGRRAIYALCGRALLAVEAEADTNDGRAHTGMFGTFAFAASLDAADALFALNTSAPAFSR